MEGECASTKSCPSKTRILSAKVSKGSCEYAILEDSDTQEHTELEDNDDEEDGGDIVSDGVQAKPPATPILPR
jgi:hypothetical protein